MSGVACNPDVATKRSMRWRRSYSVMIASLTIAATPSAGPVSVCSAAPAGGEGGSAAAGGGEAGGGGAVLASAGAAQTSSARPKTARNRLLRYKVRPFASNLNGLRARPRTGRENKRNRPRFKDGRTRLAETD